MNKINKKGFLIEEALKIILAVICIVFLIYLGFKLMYPMKTDKMKAQEQLDNIDTLINQLKNGEDSNFVITSPQDWYLRGFNKVNKPQICEEKNCLCICPSINIESCDQKGVCKKYETNLNMQIGSTDAVFIGEPKNVYIKKSGDMIEIFANEEQVGSSQILKEYLETQIEFQYKAESKKMTIEDFISYYDNFPDPRPSKELLTDILLPKSLEILKTKVGNDNFAVCFDENSPGSENCWIWINQARWVGTSKQENGNLLSEVNRPIDVNGKTIYVKMRILK